MSNKDPALKEADATVTEHGDGEDDDGELDLDFIPDEAQPLCTWSDDPDEQRRAYVVRLMATADIDGRIMVSNMDMVCQWLKSGIVPEAPRKK